MKLFVWPRAEIDRPEFVRGALVIVAANLGEALIAWREYKESVSGRPEDVLLDQPARSYQVDPYSKAEVMFFPGSIA